MMIIIIIIIIMINDDDGTTVHVCVSFSRVPQKLSVCHNFLLLPVIHLWLFVIHLWLFVIHLWLFVIHLCSSICQYLSDTPVIDPCLLFLFFYNFWGEKHKNLFPPFLNGLSIAVAFRSGLDNDFAFHGLLWLSSLKISQITPNQEISH